MGKPGVGVLFPVSELFHGQAQARGHVLLPYLVGCGDAACYLLVLLRPYTRIHAGIYGDVQQGEFPVQRDCVVVPVFEFRDLQASPGAQFQAGPAGAGDKPAEG